MKKWFALFMCLCLLFPLSACDRIEKTAASRGTNRSSNPLRIACIINGTLGDSSIFDSAHEGMKRLKDELRNAIDIDLIEMSYDDSIWESVFLDAAASNYDLLIVGTEQMGRLLEQYADQYPEKTFILFDASIQRDKGDFSNVYCMEFNLHEGAYLAGVLAASMSKSGKIACVGGADTLAVNDGMVGYIQGAKSVNPDIAVLSAFSGSFSDAEKASELAKMQFAAGADVNFNLAGPAGLGVFESAVLAGGKEAGITVLGSGVDQAEEFAENGQNDRAEITAASLLRRVDLALYDAVHAHLNGTLPSGVTRSVGLKEGYVSLIPNRAYPEAVPAQVQAAVDAAADAIVNGSVVVGSAYGVEPEALSSYRNAAAG